MTVELGVLISVSAAVCGVVLGVFTAKRGARADAVREGKSDGAVLAELGYIKAGLDDIKREQREQTKTNIELLTRLTAVEASSKQAHLRLDRAGISH